jgi:hypothetical protein
MCSRSSTICELCVGSGLGHHGAACVSVFSGQAADVKLMLRCESAPPCARWRSPFAHHIWPIYALGRVAFQAHLGNVEPCSGDRAGFFVSDVGCDVRSWSSRDRCWVEDVVSVCGCRRSFASDPLGDSGRANRDH